MTFHTLIELGWDPYQQMDWEGSGFPDDYEPGRVWRADRDRCVVATAGGLLQASVSGAFRHAASQRAHFPAVGDWVAVQARHDEGAGTIHEVLPRSSLVARQQAGNSPTVQPIATNIDVLFLTMAVDGDFNLRRLERYLALAEVGECEAVVVLTKVDLLDSDELARRISQTERIAGSTPVAAVSALAGEVGVLEPWLQRGRTVAFIGSSGAGKSTLTNAYIGEEKIRTQEIKTRDGRGQHTTTHREMHLLPSFGTWCIDTPGMKEIGLWSGGDDDGPIGFDDVDALAEECRFRDCQHESEPGCAVMAAIDTGQLDEDRLAAYRKHHRELAFQERKEDLGMQRDTKERWKAITKQMRQRPDSQRKL